MDVTNRRRFVALIHHLEVGGAEKMMVTILNHFVKEGFDVHLIIFNNSGALREELNQEIVVHNLGIASVMRGMPRCLKTLYTLKPNTVFAGIGHLNIALAPSLFIIKKLLKNSRWIARETNIVSLQNQASKYPKLFDWLYKTSYSNYDVIVAQSEDMKNDLVKNYSISTKIEVINNPIDIEKIEQLSKKDGDYSFDKSKINLLTVAGLRREKRHDLMLQAIALLPSNYSLTIVGLGEMEESLKRLAKELKIEHRIHFEGYQSNPYSYMATADLFLLTSEREGFPNVLIEANTLGLPIVAFSCLGGIEEIIEEGVNGFFVPFNNIEMFAKKIEESVFYGFDREKIKLKTIKKYNKKTILKRYMEIL